MKIKIVLTTIIGILGMVQFFSLVDAQDFSNEWSEPDLLYLVTDGIRSNFLTILSDRAEKVYTFWATINAYPEEATADQPKSITFHAQNIGGDWRSPIDVMIWPDAGRMTSVFIDQNGLVHAFSATDCLNYATAPNHRALSARAWENKGCLDEVGLAFPSAIHSSDDTFYVVYSSPDNHSYRLVQSQDGGTTWSPYRTVLEIQDSFLLDPMLTIDQKGRLHLVWSVGQAPDAYPPTGVFYSRSNDGGISWTPPIQLGGRDEGEPAIAVKNDEVHVLWNGDADKGGRYYRYSPDGGESWSSVEVISPSKSDGGNGGLQRPPAIVVDNVGNVHVLLHAQESLYYASKTEYEWTTRQALYNPDLMKGVEIFGVRLAITGGDTLHALYILESYDRSKDEDRRNHIWRVFHQSRAIDAVSEQPVPWLTSLPEGASFEIEPQDEPGEIETNTQQPPQNPGFIDDFESTNSYNPAWSIYVGVTSVSVFIITLLLILLFIKRRR